MSNMTKNASAQANDAHREKCRKHLAWQEHVAARKDLSANVRLAAWALALCRNVGTGRCDLSYAGIADRMGGVSERTAIRATAALERAGLIAIVRGAGRGHRNQFDFLMPERVTQPCQSFPDQRVTSGTGKGDSRRRKL